MADSNQKSLEARLLRLLALPKYTPLNKIDLAKKLGVPADERAVFRRVLKELELRGKITKIRKERYILPAEADLLIGVLQVNPQGFGYVLNASGDGRGDLYVSAENMGVAMHKDRVVARIIREGVTGQGPQRGRSNREGTIIKILERANQTIVGTLQRSKKLFYYVVPDDPALVHDIYVPPPGTNGGPAAEINDKVVIRLELWEHRHVNPEGEIIEVLGSARKPGVDILSIIRKHDFSVEFPVQVLAEAERVPPAIPERDLKGREDLRSAPVFTIDPDDARDFDDAIHVVESKNGWTLGIHIADVSHYVKAGSALDREAYRRGNSIYLPDRVLPMLPERLSNGVCSLRPNEDHLTKSVFAEFDRNGRLKDYRFAATVIRSAARFTYKEAFAILERSPQNPLEHHLHRAWNIASILRKRRFKEGALELDMPDVRVKVDSEGRGVGLVREDNDISHQLIEEFMLLANEIVAKATRERAVPSVYRVHEDPDPIRLQDYREQIRSYGIEVGDLSQRREMQRFLKSLVGRPEEGALKIGLLRSLRKAVYAANPIGHYGLAKTDYTHFTSPIRRYADLVVHRAFTSLLGRSKDRPPRSTELTAVCEHISATEKVAADAEREAVRLKKLEYLGALMRKPHRLEGTVVDVRNFGLMVELKEALMIGLVHLSSLDTDFFIFDQVRQQLRGRRTKMTFSVGDSVAVRVTKVDPFKQQIDLAYVARNIQPGNPSNLKA
jgi:ribonuclease R